MFSTKYRYLFIALLGTYSYLNIKFTEGDTLVTVPVTEIAFLGLLIFFVLFIWEGNRLFEFFILRNIETTLGRKLIYQFGISLIIVGLISIPAAYILVSLFPGSEFSTLIRIILGFTFRINLFLHCINAIVSFNQALHKSRLESEKLKKETSEAQFEALKNQINPHFLFNSFNALGTLIETDPKVASNFLDQLSYVYRYLLKSRGEKITSLQDEMAFIDAYLFLLRTRFWENLSIDVSVENTKDYFLPPATIQMLIENAIKHNEISKSHPLRIEIKMNGENIEVSNNVNPKNVKEESSLIGLENIRNRYILLGSEPPTISSTEEKFAVTIPLFKE